MYTTEKDIVAKAKRSFLMKRAAHTERGDGGGVPKALDLSVLESETFRRWVDGLVARARADRLLLTDRQFADWRVGRALQEGDRAKYVGQTRLEPTATGRNVMRPTGQRGRIIRVQARARAGAVLTFMPDVASETRELAESRDVDVVQLVTSAWTEFERIP